MSYDLAVFDPRDELRDATTFRTWYIERVKWKGVVHFDEAPNSTAPLQAWLRDMLNIFPPLNGPRRWPSIADAAEWDRLADYAITSDLIYVGFVSGQEGFAYDTVCRLASNHRVGVYNVSGSPGEVWFPAPLGGLEVVHSAGTGTPYRTRLT